MTVALITLMTNFGSPKECKRVLLMTVLKLILLYEAGICTDTLKMEKYRMRIVPNALPRALACAHDTELKQAILVITGSVSYTHLDVYKRQQHGCPVA